VVAQASDSQDVTSAPVTATRAAQDPAVGDIDKLMIDANRGDGVTWLQDEIAGPVSISTASNGSRTLSAGTLKFKIPAILPGPGRYDMKTPELEITQGDRSCAVSGSITITDLAYTADLDLETMAASFVGWSCAGTQEDVHGEVRVKSAKGYSALSVDPYEINAGQVRFGTRHRRPTQSRCETAELSHCSSTSWRFAQVSPRTGPLPRTTVRPSCRSRDPARRT
jgi:hypothetical protein